MGTVLTNINVYLEIAEDALAASNHLFENSTTPNEIAAEGHVMTRDPERKSFKQSLVAIAFSGMYLEALLGLVGTARLGKSLYSKIDRQTTYEEKLSLLGIYDQELLSDCKRFREARNDLMHEKHIDLEMLKAGEFRVAQNEAAHGVQFVKTVSNKLKPLS